MHPAVFAVLMLQATPAAQDSTPPARERAPQTLGTIAVTDVSTRAHRYSAKWSATATRTNTPLRDTPASVSVITKDLITEQSMRSIADAVRYAPGVTMGQGEGHRDAPTIRGNSSTADFYVDGVRDDAQYYRDLYNLERVEVLGGPNAMIFGRGGGGGVINRVTKQAEWRTTRALTVEGGSYGHRRGTLDVGGAVNATTAVRVAGMAETGDGFRDAFEVKRFGVSPGVSFRLGDRTALRVSGEYYSDERTVDRGLPSFRGRPSPAPLETFFGNPAQSFTTAEVGAAAATLEHQLSSRVMLRSTARAMAYDKYYQNVYPGPMDAAGTNVSLSAYSNDLQRENYFNQTELALRLASARMPQTILVGVELGRQSTDNLRLTGYFPGGGTSLSVPFADPTTNSAVSFTASATDANNHVLANVASVYAQDQIWLSPRWQATLGVRFERFDLRLFNHRNRETLTRRDALFSPRAGLVFKPIEPVSLYTSYSMSHLPAAGDQFSGLTPSTRTLEPERFTSYEVGAKWDVAPALSLTAAAYEGLRYNSAAPSALDPAVTVQTGKQRTTGVEMSASGRLAPRWDVVGAFTSQRSKVVSQIGSAPAGRTMPLVPRTTFALWNRVQPATGIAVGLGAVHQSSMFAAIDNAVTLPGFWRVDGALYLGGMRSGARLQLNVENLFNERYYATSHGNNNIMPGTPRSARISIITRVR